MSIEATSHYLSDAEIMAWMEQKTDGLYQTMRDAMNVANDRAELESALGTLQAQIEGSKSGAVSVEQVYETVSQLHDKYPQFPEATQMLNQLYDQLHASKQASMQPITFHQITTVNGLTLQMPVPPPAFTLPDADRWTTEIKNKVDFLGKQDQLGLITIQDVNSQINQTKQIASNLIDAASKSASSIVANIRA